MDNNSSLKEFDELKTVADNILDAESHHQREEKYDEVGYCSFTPKG